MTLRKRQPPMLSEYSEPRLVAAIHDSWNHMMKMFARYPGCEYREAPGFSFFDSSLNIAMFNRVFDTNLTGKEADRKIEETREYFASRSLPFTWQVDPGNKPADLADRLERAGFVRDLTPGMAIEIHRLVKPAEPKGFTYEEVETPKQNRDYARLLCEAYGIPEDAWEFMSNFYRHLGVVDHLRHYVGFLDGKPVATSSILYAEGVAGLYNVASLPEARGRGVGSMISAVPFHDAVDRGYRIGILHSSSMGYNVYRRLGFEEICQLVRYQWSPAPP